MSDFLFFVGLALFIVVFGLLPGLLLVP